MTRAALLEARGLRKTFRGRSGVTVVAVDHVDLEIAPGECVGLVGESGCGKSTVARLLLRLIEPSDGTLRFDGDDLRALDAGRLREARRALQIVFQNPHAALNPRMTVVTAIAEALLIQGLADRAAARRRATEMLDLIGLPRAFSHRYPHELSGGQKQRVCIARALAVSPRLLVLDEPTSALDVSVQAQILDLLARLQRDLKLAFLLISHNLAVVRAMASRVHVMYRGRIVETGAAATIMRAPSHPYTRLLLAASLEPEPGVRLPPPEAELPSGAMGQAPACAFFARCSVRRVGLCDRRVPLPVATGEGWAACHLTSETA